MLFRCLLQVMLTRTLPTQPTVAIVTSGRKKLITVFAQATYLYGPRTGVVQVDYGFFIFMRT